MQSNQKYSAAAVAAAKTISRLNAYIAKKNVSTTTAIFADSAISKNLGVAQNFCCKILQKIPACTRNFAAIAAKFYTQFHIKADIASKTPFPNALG